MRPIEGCWALTGCPPTLQTSKPGSLVSVISLLLFFIRSRTPTSAVRVWINTAGSISTYMTGPVISDNHTHLSHTQIQHVLCLACSGTSLCLCQSFRPILDTHAPKSQSRCERQTTGSCLPKRAEKYLFFSLNSVSWSDSTTLPSPSRRSAPVGPSRVH